MIHALVVYYSCGGHTARIARVITETLCEQGAQCDMMDMTEGMREGIAWERYNLIIVGACVIYGGYNKVVWDFVERFKYELTSRPHSFFNVTVVARTPCKATVEGNRYMQRFLEKSNWTPRDLKCIAGKVDYPHWKWYQSLAIRLIMDITHGPTDPTAIIDYTDWEDVKAYAKHCLTLVPNYSERIETTGIAPSQKPKTRKTPIRKKVPTTPKSKSTKPKDAREEKTADPVQQGEPAV